jgi:hypothetical protein
MLFAFGLTLFVSALLLFLLEPMIGKMILPLLGGTPAVWNTCMVFYQVVLLAGYAYAHFSTTYLGTRKQALLHLVVLLVPFFFFPLDISRRLLEGSEEGPVLRLLLVLVVCVGMPLFVVCTTAPLLQRWFAATKHRSAHDPYFLYGASNLGSMLALLAYPTLIEPSWALRQQAWHWSIAYAVLAALSVLCAWLVWQSSHRRALLGERPPRVATKSSGWGPGAPGWQPLTGPVTWARRCHWLFLAAVPSSLMLGTTTYITTDLAAIPLLWVVPLALYLLSFIIVFSRIPMFVQSAALALFTVTASCGMAWLVWQVADETGRHELRFLVLCCAGAAAMAYWIWDLRVMDLWHKFMVLALPLLVLLVVFLVQTRASPHLEHNIALHLLTLFVACMVCHGELARDRPGPQHLTEFYLWMSIGGSLGGTFNALAAPLLFRTVVEHLLALAAVCFLVPPLFAQKGASGARKIDIILGALMLGIGGALIARHCRDDGIHFEYLAGWQWQWEAAALIGGLGLGVCWALADRRSSWERWLDVLLPIALGLFAVGLRWALDASPLGDAFVPGRDRAALRPARLPALIAIGLPALLCYTFVGRCVRFGLGVGALLLASVFTFHVAYEPPLLQVRTFFGVMEVRDLPPEDTGDLGTVRQLMHGTTIHGQQSLEPDHSGEPLTYYHPTGPLAQLFRTYNHDPRRPFGVIGLGTGTMACFALPGQHVIFYDIDPTVRDLSFAEPGARFTFVAQARRRGAHPHLILGDARIQLERQQLSAAEKYRFLIVDAFSSDAIPMHLITREAVQEYLTKVSDDGLVLFHISNRYLRLAPVLANLAADLGLSAQWVEDREGCRPRQCPYYPNKFPTTWVVLARREEHLTRLGAPSYPLAVTASTTWPDGGTGLAAHALLLQKVAEKLLPQIQWRPLRREEWPERDRVGVWTDDYSNLFSVLHRGDTSED